MAVTLVAIASLCCLPLGVVAAAVGGRESSFAYVREIT